ncbi:ribonucleoside triphosphate reductase [Candidatus Falkowbacteria bacterium RIFOXYB2_FULL_34_18]|uniref:Ribonucleoside triphosphate reductase n=1 Tax=Candidatus Falkowbacteria bacterium RIFOXYD2_FULL_34_120 TaxID=1798007 RepID=A0A1F5TRT7_9BACT|nr:MAG: ribonucleoside triphosphate reductase [Candidatus Falkowbacteria bacterium RIFOXYB2_FULL_34_18]OGF29952.1 MAG: ribonucleoside triphosphate reductase [Candidatus Falkowbacteria bacterium RIFOXYC12_FULL_34_55]OGF37190.1 MAG: ribonucleoside triphosphate reductase [Candidatus Falkowbacteria bacterium RIFOXYC2_FULL_34_220]OGF39490.1 MAG: ribonucleoside triphosphate reductase [Candidatus Falkowbacteria bacterium RIFOXYD12_FULL_34_57]OGF41528.1 MAG: ribonucleoside triphosphate reductase [Candi
MSKIKQIKKRNREIVDFDQEKIVNAILKSLNAVERLDSNEKRARKYSNEVVSILNKKFHRETIPSVEEIQDIVEEVLISNREIKTAKAFILFRDQKARIRELDSRIDSNDIMESYLKRSDWRVKENSNMSYSLQGLNNHLASVISSNYWLSKVYSANIREARQNGEIHIHDLQLLAPYCAGWDLKDLLIRGFKGVSGKIESKPPKHFRTALGQIINFFYTIQGEVAGAQAFSSFDTYLAPFIRYDDLNYREIKQGIQEFLFNINVPTRVGFQTPFTNITMDITPSKLIGEEYVIIGGELQKEKYKDFQKEMDMLNLAFAEAMMDGDAKGRVFTFPIPTYNITKNFAWDSPVAEKVFDMTAKYGIPYFSNYINSDMDPDDARSMCCRLRLDNRELRKRGGGLFGANPLTGSIGVVTVNLPRVGYLSKTREDFFKRLDNTMQISKESLEMKRKVLEDLTERGLYPYARYYLSDIKERFGTYWQNHFATIGIVGMNEALLNFKLIGKDITTPEGKAFAIEVLDYMRERMMDFQNDTNNLYNLEATPAEGTSRRLAQIDKNKYPDIIVANEVDVREKGATPYYTNSSQLPVGFTDDLFEALDLQDDVQTRYTGGTVLHGFLGEAMPNSESVKKLVKNIATNYTLPYFTITPTFSICPKHGYISGEHHFCPKCDAEMGYNEKNSKTRVEVKFEEDEEGVINNESQAMNIETASNENIDSLTKPAFDIERNLIQAIA